MAVCEHLDQAHDVAPTPDNGCAECLATGGAWVHLRMCATCGHVGCCDASPGQHASRHAGSDGHPLIRSYEPAEAWWYCYEEAIGFEVPGVGPLTDRHYSAN